MSIDGHILFFENLWFEYCLLTESPSISPIIVTNLVQGKGLHREVEAGSNFLT